MASAVSLSISALDLFTELASSSTWTSWITIPFPGTFEISKLNSANKLAINSWATVLLVSLNLKSISLNLSILSSDTAVPPVCPMSKSNPFAWKSAYILSLLLVT